MARVARICTVGSLILWLYLSGTSFAKDSLTWAKLNFPPFHIIEGEYAGQGIGDEIITLLQENLPEYDHAIEIIPISRLHKLLQEGAQVSNVVLLKTTEREKFMYYSAPSFIMPSHGITLKRKTLERLGNVDKISLEQLLKNQEYRLGIADRSYGTKLDAILQAHQGQEHIYKRGGEDIYNSLFKMMLSDRIDYLIGYPLEAGFAMKKFGGSGEVINIPLEESDPFIMFYAVCPKTAWGEKLLQQINQILKEHRPTDRYRGFFERWLDENSLERFREAYQTHFISSE